MPDTYEDRIIESIVKVILYARDTETALFHVRKTAEIICKEIYENEFNTEPGDVTIGWLLRELAPKKLVPRKVWFILTSIRTYGGANAHDNVSESSRRATLDYFPDLVEWYFKEYKKTRVPIQIDFRSARNWSFSTIPIPPRQVEPIPSSQITDSDGEEVTIVQQKKETANPESQPRNAAADSGIEQETNSKVPPPLPPDKPDSHFTPEQTSAIQPSRNPLAFDYFYSNIPLICRKWAAWAGRTHPCAPYMAGRKEDDYYYRVAEFADFLKIWWPEHAYKLLFVTVKDVQAFSDRLARHRSRDSRKEISILSSLYEFLKIAARYMRIGINVTNPAGDFIGNICAIEVSSIDLTDRTSFQFEKPVRNSKVRLYDLAKEFNVDTKTLMDQMRREGFDFNGHSDSILRPLAEKVRARWHEVSGIRRGGSAPGKAQGRSLPPPLPSEIKVSEGRIVFKLSRGLAFEEITPEEAQAIKEGKGVWKVAKIENLTSSSITFQVLNEDNSWAQESLEPRGSLGSSLTFWRRNMSVVVKFRASRGSKEISYSLVTEVVIGRPPTESEQSEAPSNFFLETNDELRLCFRATSKRIHPDDLLP
jgi:hypothetical protein